MKPACACLPVFFACELSKNFKKYGYNFSKILLKNHSNITIILNITMINTVETLREVIG